MLENTITTLRPRLESSSPLVIPRLVLSGTAVVGEGVGLGVVLPVLVPPPLSEVVLRADEVLVLESRKHT